MSCSKVKNYCKICLQHVTRKTGLQCQGVCASWVHYSCLNYTPGKISDIKSGYIKVTCPCPDCKSTQPKEYIKDQGFNCTNQNCPAKIPPKCENKMCPVNVQFPSLHSMNSKQTCPLGNSGKSCKKHSAQNLTPFSRVPSQCSNGSGSRSSSSGSPSPPSRMRAGDAKGGSVTSLCNVEQLCNTVGLLTNQINELMAKMKDAVAAAPGCFPNNQQISCSRKGSRSKCPKPCFCSRNHAKKK